MGTVDTQWFKDRFADKKLSLRGLAKLMDMSPSSLSLRINGEYKISTAEAGVMARLLGVEYEDLIRRAGVDVPRESGRAIKVVGVVDSKGGIKGVKGGGQIPRPGGISSDTVAAKGGPDGWTYLYTPSQKLQPEAVGRLAVVDNRWLGVLERGSERGLWNVRGVVEGVRVASATPILMILP